MHSRNVNLVSVSKRSIAIHFDNGASEGQRLDLTFCLPIENGLAGRAKQNCSKSDSSDVIRGKLGMSITTRNEPKSQGGEVGCDHWIATW